MITVSLRSAWDLTWHDQGRRWRHYDSSDSLVSEPLQSLRSQPTPGRPTKHRRHRLWVQRLSRTTTTKHSDINLQRSLSRRLTALCPRLHDLADEENLLSYNETEFMSLGSSPDAADAFLWLCHFFSLELLCNQNLLLPLIFKRLEHRWLHGSCSYWLLCTVNGSILKVVQLCLSNNNLAGSAANATKKFSIFFWIWNF